VYESTLRLFCLDQTTFAPRPFFLRSPPLTQSPLNPHSSLQPAPTDNPRADGGFLDPPQTSPPMHPYSSLRRIFTRPPQGRRTDDFTAPDDIKFGTHYPTPLPPVLSPCPASLYVDVGARPRTWGGRYSTFHSVASLPSPFIQRYAPFESYKSFLFQRHLWPLKLLSVQLFFFPCPLSR